jgi:microsomal dipeptidase-like Zn-dependent dipeptidase
MMRPGLPVLLSLLAACKADAPADTEAGSSTAGSSTAASSTASTGDTTPTTGEPLPPLSGVADLHLHMFAEEAFGGGWFHGSHTGPGDVALAPCDGGSPGDHGRLQDDLAPLLGSCEGITLEELGAKVPLVAVIAADGGGAVVSEFVSNIPGSAGDTGQHADRTQGWPELAGWPRWDAIAHQQVWEEQLHAAYMGGLRIEVMSAVSLDWLCRALPPENLERPQCDEMDDVKLQLEQAHAFVAQHDWAEIALTPADARRIVEEDRLAIILSIEASHLMGAGDWRAQLDDLRARGAHIAAGAPARQPLRRGRPAQHDLPDRAIRRELSHRRGLRPDHRRPDARLRRRRRLQERARPDRRGQGVDHGDDGPRHADRRRPPLREGYPRRPRHRRRPRPYYPIYISHGHFREIMTEEKQREEKTTPAWVIELLRETGGMIGLRTGHEEVNTYEPSAVDNSCHGSSRSFAQAYDFGRLGLKVAIGLGSDLNGFIQQTRPRFGPQACSASFPTEALCQAQDQRDAGPAPLGTGFDELGLGHIGLLTELLADLDQLGSDTAPLRSSADDFVRMWERAAGPRSGPAEAVDDLDVAGVTVLPAHSAREAAFPSECNVHYCPAALATGAACRFDAECVSGSCVGAGDCGKPQGSCA